MREGFLHFGYSTAIIRLLFDAMHASVHAWEGLEGKREAAFRDPNEIGEVNADTSFWRLVAMFYLMLSFRVLESEHSETSEEQCSGRGSLH